MLFKAHILDEIRSGTVTAAFHFWIRPTVKTGGAQRTPVGVLSIDRVAPVALDEISEDDAMRAGFGSLDALLATLRGQRRGTLYRIDFHLSGPDPRETLMQQDHLETEELKALRRKLDAFDRRSRSGEWTAKTLHLISERDGRTAAEIAGERLF